MVGKTSNYKIVNGLNGIDIGSIMGLIRNRTVYDVYSEKVNYIVDSYAKPKEESEEEYWDLTFREIIAQEYSIRTNKKVRKESKLIIDGEHDFIVGNIDKRIVGENSILICKTENIFSKKEWCKRELPESYILEAQHNMRVYRAEKCFIASIFAGKKFIYREVTRDNKIIDMIIQIEKDFWNNNILKRVPPKKEEL